jgi:hypothetical protein
MSYIYYNPNPKGKDTGDCVVRALTLLFDKTWYDIYTELCSLGFEMCELPSSDRLWGNYLQKNGYKRTPLPDYCPICYTVADFCRENQRGEYLLALNGHVVYVLNGDYYDSWDSGSKYPLFVWKRKGAN